MAPALGTVLFSGDAASVRERAGQVEALGFAAVALPDHLGYYPPLTSCAIVAEATSRVQLGPLVLNNDFRHPVVLAHEAAALADLSNGRFELGLGAGYARREYERAGIPFDARAVRIARLAESARILNALFAGETVDFDGEHYQVHAQGMPAGSPRVPIMIGGNSRELHAVAAEHADIVGLAGSPKSGEGHGSDYAAAAVERQVGRIRARAELEVHVLVQWHEVTNDRELAVEHAAQSLGVSPEVARSSPYVLVGSPDEIAAQLHDEHDRFGIARWTIFADRPDLQPAEALVPVLELLASP